MDEDFDEDENELHEDDKFTEEQIIELTDYGFTYDQIQQLETVNLMNVPNFVIEIMNTYPTLNKFFLIQLFLQYNCSFEKVRNIFDLMIKYGFTREQILQLINLDLDFYDMYDNIRHIINSYPQEPDLDVRISNQTLLNLLEQGYSFEDIESLLEYDLIDEDFEWLTANPQFIYENIYHALGDGFSFNEIKNQLENMSDDEAELGGKRRQKSKKQYKTRRRKQCKTRKRTQRKTRKSKRRKH
jgi:hypothetical protein